MVLASGSSHTAQLATSSLTLCAATKPEKIAALAMKMPFPNMETSIPQLSKDNQLNS